MSPKKLQKLVYYAYAWTLALLNERVDELNTRLFHDRIEAWVHGPVIPSLYHHYKAYGWDDIPMIESEVNVSEDVRDILEQVWNAYGQFSANELESISHSETPWINARRGVSACDPCNARISDEEIFNFYNSNGR